MTYDYQALELAYSYILFFNRYNFDTGDILILAFWNQLW